ncbi:MAG: hypothetical protein RIE53_00195 [Rhodothermales bacterium]
MFFDEGEIEGYVPPENDALYFNYIMADAAYGPALGTELVAGRWFREDETDTGVLVNEAAVRRLGWDSVIGVFENIHMEALHKEVLPMIMTQDEASSRYVVLNVAGGDVTGVLAAVEGIWKEFLPDQPFAYSFLDDEFAAMYADERRGAPHERNRDPEGARRIGGRTRGAAVAGVRGHGGDRVYRIDPHCMGGDVPVARDLRVSHGHHVDAVCVGGPGRARACGRDGWGAGGAGGPRQSGGFAEE